MNEFPICPTESLLIGIAFGEFSTGTPFFDAVALRVTPYCGFKEEGDFPSQFFDDCLIDYLSDAIAIPGWHAVLRVYPKQSRNEWFRYVRRCTSQEEFIPELLFPDMCQGADDAELIKSKIIALLVPKTPECPYGYRDIFEVGRRCGEILGECRQYENKAWEAMRVGAPGDLEEFRNTCCGEVISGVEQLTNCARFKNNAVQDELQLVIKRLSADAHPYANSTSEWELCSEFFEFVRIAIGGILATVRSQLADDDARWRQQFSNAFQLRLMRLKDDASNARMGGTLSGLISNFDRYAPEEINSTLGPIAEALTKDLWPEIESGTNFGDKLYKLWKSKQGSGLQIESRFLGVAVSFQKLFRNNGVHWTGTAKSKEETLAILAQAMFLYSLANQVRHARESSSDCKD